MSLAQSNFTPLPSLSDKVKYSNYTSVKKLDQTFGLNIYEGVEGGKTSIL